MSYWVTRQNFALISLNIVPKTDLSDPIPFKAFSTLTASVSTIMRSMPRNTACNIPSIQAAIVSACLSTQKIIFCSYPSSYYLSVTVPYNAAASSLAPSKRHHHKPSIFCLCLHWLFPKFRPLGDSWHHCYLLSTLLMFAGIRLVPRIPPAP